MFCKINLIYVMLQVNDAKEIKNTEIAKELSLPPVKLHCSSKLKLLQTRRHWY